MASNLVVGDANGVLDVFSLRSGRNDRQPSEADQAANTDGNPANATAPIRTSVRMAAILSTPPYANDIHVDQTTEAGLDLFLY
jgi:hypothetical protein